MAQDARRPLVAGNWKMNGSTDMAESLAAAVGRGAGGASDVAILPPFPYLATVAKALAGTDVALGAQDLSERSEGAFTGDVSGAMLADVGARYVLVGHSERRALHGETDEVAAEKFMAARRAGLQPVLCVGETRDEREAGRTETVIAAQVDVVLGAGGIEAFDAAVIAYEPVWAIGTGLVATPEQAQRVHAFIRARLADHDATIAGQIRILYGGSMKPRNAADLIACDDIDGGLIGGASLDADDFLAIVSAAG
ncbi:MAG: triose-phosphate isomerase [Candidatus Wenzhouxiangella sp. M2_3B_020]